MNRIENANIGKGNALVKANNLILLTNKLLKGLDRKDIILYDLAEYSFQRNAELAFIAFIKKNIWSFLNEIIEQTKNENLSTKPFQPDFIIGIAKHDLFYEYPRSFYRTRGRGTTLVDKAYDKLLKEKNEPYIFCSPPIDEEFKKKAFQNITCYVAGTILTEYADTSIGQILGLIYNNDLRKTAYNIGIAASGAGR